MILLLTTSVLGQWLDFNSRKEFYFLKDIQGLKTKGKITNVYADSREASQFQKLAEEASFFIIMLYFDQMDRHWPVFRCSTTAFTNAKQVVNIYAFDLMLKVWMWTGRWAPLLHIDVKVLCPISKRVRKINPARPGGQGGAQATRAIQSLKRRRDFGSLIPVSKSDWEKRVQLDTRWQLVTVTCSGHNEWSVPGEVTPQQRSWHDLPPVRVPRSAPPTHTHEALPPTTCTQHLCVPGWVCAGDRRHQPRARVGTSSSLFPNRVGNKVGWASHIRSCLQLGALPPAESILRGTDVEKWTQKRGGRPELSALLTCWFRNHRFHQPQFDLQ